MQVSKFVVKSIVLSALVMGSAMAQRVVVKPGARGGAVIVKPGARGGAVVVRPGARPGRVAPRPIPRPRPALNKIVTLQLNQQYQGSSSIALKMLLKSQYPYLNLQALKIKKVSLLAKSQMGRATAKLQIGQQHTYAHTIPGSPQLFHINGPRTFSQVLIQAPAYQMAGPMAQWQIDMNGNIKVKSVTLTLGR